MTRGEGSASQTLHVLSLTPQAQQPTGWACDATVQGTTPAPQQHPSSVTDMRVQALGGGEEQPLCSIHGEEPQASPQEVSGEGRAYKGCEASQGHRRGWRFKQPASHCPSMSHTSHRAAPCIPSTVSPSVSPAQNELANPPFLGNKQH